MAKVALFQITGWEQEYETQKLKEAGIEVDCYTEGVDVAQVADPDSYDTISVFVGPSVNQQTIEKFSNLKLISTRSTGFDHIDQAYADARGLALGYVPHYGENTVAEFAMGLILTLSRKLYASIDRIKEEDNFSFDGLEGIDVKGKTLGVIGAGRIGRHVIKMAKGFDMEVVAYDRNPDPDVAEKLGFTYVSFDELLAQSDIITIHLFYAPSTHHLINREAVAKMKKGVLLVNTARGPIVDTQALVLGLKDGTIGGAGLDVLEEEGVLKDEQGFWLRNADDNADDTNLRTVLENHVLIDMPNVIVTPHNAFNTREAKTRILEADIQNIISFFSDGKVQDPVPTKTD